MNINFRSARGKKPAIINMINSVQPDIIIGTESHIDADISDTEFLPSNYKTHIKERNKYDGGVLIALREELFELSSRVHELESNCEILWIKLKSKDLLLIALTIVPTPVTLRATPSSKSRFPELAAKMTLR